ncbi:MAG: SH3 domain-containing protein [Syntrophobacteraceae bacterium]
MKHFPLLSVFVTVFFFGTAALAASGMMSVQVRSAELRDSPSFLGKTRGIVSYGERVEVLNQQAGWLEVNSSGEKKGWIHQSALTRKRIAFSSGLADAKPVASEEELALAGRGFSADIEAKFKLEHSDIDFTWVDKMEQIKILPGDMTSFLRQGGLEWRAEGAK